MGLGNQNNQAFSSFFKTQIPIIPPACEIDSLRPAQAKKKLANLYLKNEMHQAWWCTEVEAGGSWSEVSLRKNSRPCLKAKRAQCVVQEVGYLPSKSARPQV
jgi:hypothetical protein